MNELFEQILIEEPVFNCRIRRRDIGYLGIKKQHEYRKNYASVLKKQNKKT